VKKIDGKSLSLKTETVRSLSNDEMNKVAGGMPWYCWLTVVPSSGATTTVPITLTKCND
jgi:hypothetical protein